MEEEGEGKKWEVDRKERGGGRSREGWVGGPLCEILNTPLAAFLLFNRLHMTNAFSTIDMFCGMTN